MKKVLFSFLAVLFLFASCEGPPGRDGRDGRDTVRMIFDYEIRNSNWPLTWQWTGDAYVCVISIPQLTRQIYENGVVMVFHEWFDGSIWRQQPLPQSIPQGNGVDLWTEHLDFDYFIGGIRIFYSNSDFFYEMSPGIRFFRVVFLM
jgi:hypothetical protein